MEFIYAILAFAGGMMLPMQVGINAELAKRAGAPEMAAFISFAVGTAVLLVYVLLVRTPWPGWSKVAGFPWWIWLGGLMGAFVVFLSIVVGPHLGALLLVALILAGQIFASLTLDHYGFLAFPVQELTWGRVTGAILVLVGVILLRKF